LILNWLVLYACILVMSCYAYYINHINFFFNDWLVLIVTTTFCVSDYIFTLVPAIMVTPCSGVIMFCALTEYIFYCSINLINI